MENTGGIGSPVKDFVKAFLGEAEDALIEKEYQSCPEQEAHIRIELNATEVKEVGGGLKIHVFSIGSNTSDSNTQKMTIYAKKTDKLENKAKKESSKAKIKQSKDVQKNKPAWNPTIC